MMRVRSKPNRAVPWGVLAVGLLGLAAWAFYAQGENHGGPDAPVQEGEGEEAAEPSGPPGPAEILGTSWKLIERWATLNERCSRLHDHLEAIGDAAQPALVAAEEATWPDLHGAYDSVMQVASTLEKADAEAVRGDAAARQARVDEARELIERSEALLTQASERLASVGY